MAGIDGIFKMFSGMGAGGMDFGGMDFSKMNSEEVFRQFVLTVLRSMHAQTGRLIDQLSGPVMDPFEILGVGMDATKEQVNKAYREKAKQYHPDKGGSAGDMTRLNLAYEVIMKLKGWTK